jgi:hypothetical protein
MSEIDPVRYLIDSNESVKEPTELQLRTFGRFMNENLSKASHRIPVIQAITGFPTQSTKDFTIGTISILIDTLVDVVHVSQMGESWNEWEPSDWFLNVVPGIEHLIELEGGVCPAMFLRKDFI